MKYMGSKSRIAADIVKILNSFRKDGQPFIDLFCGSCSIVEKMNGVRIANDNNKYLIAMWKGLIAGRDRPKIINKELYEKARFVFNYGFGNLDDFMVGWIGWMASFNGRFFDGGYSGHDVNGRDYIREQIENTEAQISLLQSVNFKCSDFTGVEFPPASLIYCDIPYFGTKQYSTSKKFNHTKFFEWCRQMKEKGHVLVISEYKAPDDFTCIWEKQVTNSLHTTKTTQTVERLFTL